VYQGNNGRLPLDWQRRAEKTGSEAYSMERSGICHFFLQV
jgi:hypothetical protein